MRQVVVGLTLVCLAWSSAGKRPAYVDCETSEECGKGACCVIGTSNSHVKQLNCNNVKLISNKDTNEVFYNYTLNRV